LFIIFVASLLFCFLGAIFQIRYEPEVSTREQKTLAAVDSSFFKRLPNEILVEIFKYIAPLDLVRNVAAVSKRFFHIVKNGISVNSLEISEEKDYAHTNTLCKVILPNALMSLTVGEIHSWYTAEHASQLLKHIQSTCKSVCIGGNWHFAPGLMNKFFNLLLHKKSILKLEFKISGQTFEDFWLPLSSTGYQFDNVQHLKIKFPHDDPSSPNHQLTEGTKELFQIFPNLETLLFEGYGSNMVLEGVFAVQPPEKQLPIRRLSLDYRALPGFPWRNVKNITALNLVLNRERYHYDFQAAWLEEHLEIVRNQLPLLKNLTHLGLQLDLRHLVSGYGQSLMILRNLIENNLPRNLLAIFINCPRNLSKEEAGAMLQRIVDQCQMLEVIVLTNLTNGLSPTNILNFLKQCKNVDLFVVQGSDQIVPQNRTIAFSPFVKYHSVQNQKKKLLYCHCSDC